MPKITDANVSRETDDGVCGPVEMLRFSDSGGLTQFGALVEILPPGSASALKHWHAAEDEMVYVLEGTATLVEGDTEVLLTAGEVATFKAGDPVGHRIENRSDFDLRYLVIGTRATEDTVTYPDHDRVLRRSGARDIWEDGTGKTATNPYTGS